MKWVYDQIYGRPLLHVVYAIVISVVIWTLIALVTKRLHFEKWYCLINRLLLVFSIIVVAGMTVASRNTETYQFQLIPFYSFIEAKIQPEIYRSMLMNVFLFVPLGLTMPYALPDSVKHIVKTTVFASCAFSATIELLQLVFRLGRCETDDLICNTLGASIGAISFLIFDWVTRKQRNST